MDKTDKLVLVIVIVATVLLVTLLTISLHHMTTTLVTIEHKWTENGNYYFSDTNENIYQMGTINTNKKYSNLKRVRFDEIELGEQYEIVGRGDFMFENTRYTYGETKIKRRRWKMIFKEEDKVIIKRISSNSIYARQSELDNNPISEIKFLSLVVFDSAMFAETLWKRGDYEHATEYVQNGIECNIRIMKRFREIKHNMKKRK